MHLSKFDFRAAGASVRSLREIAQIFAGPLALHCDCMIGKAHQDAKKCIVDTCDAHFEGKAIMSMGAHFAMLGLQISATPDEIRKAYLRASKTHHPDKQGGSTVMQQRIVQAKECLSDQSACAHLQRTTRFLFAADIQRVLKNMDNVAIEFMEEHAYGKVRQVLESLHQVQHVSGLIPEQFQVQGMWCEILRRVREHVIGTSTALRAQVRDHSWKRVRESLGRLKLVEETLGAYQEVCSKDWTRDSRREIQEQLEAVACNAQKLIQGSEVDADSGLLDFAYQLLLLGYMYDDLPDFQSQVEMKLCRLLDVVQERHWGFTFLFKLGIVLEQGKAGRKGSADDERIGKLIVQDFPHFKDLLTMIWNQQTEVSQKDIMHTIEELTSTCSVSGCDPVEVPIPKVALLEGRDRYKKEYQNHFQAWRSGCLDLEALACNTIEMARKLQPCTVSEWTTPVQNAIPILLGGIFAYLSISKSGSSYRRLMASAVGDSEIVHFGDQSCDTKPPILVNGDSILMRPHDVQILTILRLLSLGSNDGDLANHLLQVRTCEGKSIILGACSTVLALLGFDVRCVCYSSYLTTRDANFFKEVFEAFGGRSRIKYSTITELTEDMLCARGNVFDMTAHLVNGHSPNLGSRSSTSASSDHILLLDEVDVFFGDNFYGDTWNPNALLASPEVTHIFHQVWTMHGQAFSSKQMLQSVKNSQEFDVLCRRFPEWTFLLEDALSSMCRDVGKVNSRPYHYDRASNRIGYTELDEVNYRRFYGYQTAFAYMAEATKGNLRDAEEALAAALNLTIPCGRFLYCNISPSRILGVSGTLHALGAFEWRILNNYGLQVYTDMPSVYGRSNFRFLDQSRGEPVTVSSECEHFCRVTDAVKQTSKAGRATIVFFKDASKLRQYVGSPYFVQLRNASILSETLSHVEKEHIIRKAATIGQTTLTTAMFGRGTDFLCHDSKLLEAGGVHIIQTFVSADKAEEVQIQGRTARQGKKGTYSLVLEVGELERLGIGAEQAKSLAPASLYALIDSNREKLRRATEAEIVNMMERNRQLDVLSRQYLDALIANDRHRAKARFNEMYQKLPH
mmetsp:Transcript_175699/g.558037  ORF Transcript_175699/g.558037 Transcript_175699/m.558037 type:complete len:1076 (-) Transcript_175699:522-3749(-)